MAAQIAQNYLELHKIGPLFENLMATLIKDMPNEPIPYLIRMLQKADQKLRSPRGVSAHDRSKSASTTALHSRYGIGVSGQPAPKRSIEEPHMALPGGGKNSASAWSSRSLSASHARPPSADQKKRGYQKPWLAGSKTGPKSESLLPTKKTERPTSSKKKGDWNTDTKVKAKDFDELLQTQQEETSKPLCLQNSEHEKLKHYEGAKSWAAGEENLPPNRQMKLVQKVKSVVDSNDEMDFKSIPTKSNFEPMETDSVKMPDNRKKSKSHSKAVEKRMKLKALLSEEAQKMDGISDDGDESADEAVEVLEYADDLEGEGVCNAKTAGSKLKSHKTREESSNFQIKICARCAKVMTTTPYQLSGGFSDIDSEYTSRQKTALSDIAGSEEDFESVSQIGDPSSQKWPVLKSEEGSKDFSSKIFGQAESTASAGQTDFFARNAPRRGEGSQEETQHDNSGIQSDVSASDVLEPNAGSAWAVRPAESSTDFQ